MSSHDLYTDNGFFGNNRRKLAALASGAILFALPGCAPGEAQAKAPEVAAAPANPTEKKGEALDAVISPVGIEEKTGSGSVETATDVAEFNENNVPLILDLDGDGKAETYTGVDALVEKLEMKADDFWVVDNAKETATRVAEHMAAAFDANIQFFADQDLKKKYEGFESSDKEWLGRAAVNAEFVRPALKEAFVGETNVVSMAANSSPEKYMEYAEYLALQTGNRDSILQKEGKSYQLDYKLSGPVEIEYADSSRPVVAFKMPVSVVDNYEESGIQEATTSNYEGLSDKHEKSVTIEVINGYVKIIDIR